LLNYTTEGIVMVGFSHSLTLGDILLGYRGGDEIWNFRY